MQIDVHYVDHTARVRTGKHCHSVSKLDITPEIFGRYRLADRKRRPAADGTEP